MEVAAKAGLTVYIYIYIYICVCVCVLIPVSDILYSPSFLSFTKQTTEYIV